MKVQTPSISWHNREKVAALDFQPVDYPPPPPDSGGVVRLATAGHDHHVVIWDLSGSRESGEEADGGKCVPQPICDLSRHQNNVNIVRWSRDGKLLAAGDTDNAVLIWHYLDYDAAPDIFGEDPAPDDEDAPTQKENWSVWKVLRGHLQDVVSLEFNPSATQLVTCSVDGTAIIFDVNKGTKQKILADHKGWVNGVAWDPLDKFITSIASDRYLRVYSTKSPFKLVSKSNKAQLSVGVNPETGEPREERNVRLFHDDSYQSFHRRIAFSPDGELLIVPSGVLEIDGEDTIPNCTYIFTRLNFTKPVLFLPHKECSMAARFSPVKYKLRQLKPNHDTAELKEDEATKPWNRTATLFALPYRMVYAVATLKTVILYDTQQELPFARVSNIHYIGLTDLSWSADGNTLTVSSIDGFCSIISFKKGEIGEVYLEPEKENMDIENGGDDECTKTSGNQTSASKSEGSSAAADKQNGVGGNSISDSTNLFKPKKNEEDLIKEPVATTIQVRKKLGVAKTENNTPESEKIASVIQVKKKSSSSPSSPAVASSDAKEPPEAMPIQIKKKPSSKASTEKPVNTIQTKKKPSSSSSAAATAAPANSIQFKKKPGPKAEEKMDVDESS